MRLAYQTFGEGYPLIILHGLFGSSENWQTLSRRFAQCYRVYAIDQRNHGRSPHSAIMNYQVMAEDLHQFMHYREISSAYAIGHSMGGKTAMQFALTHPRHVDKLVIVDIAPRAYPGRRDEELEAMLALDPAKYPRRKDAEEALAPRVPNLSVRQFLLKNLGRDATGTFHWRIGLNEIKGQEDAITGAVTAEREFEKPALFVRGERSRYISKQDEADIRRLFPFARFVTVPGVGHWVHAEARRQFARLVLAFLGNV